jgi:hypothetical protein
VADFVTGTRARADRAVSKLPLAPFQFGAFEGKLRIVSFSRDRASAVSAFCFDGSE